MDFVNIYIKGGLGGSGKLGIIPNQYSDTIKSHLLSKPNNLISGPSTNNYEAYVSMVTSSSVTIVIELIPNEVLIEEFQANKTQLIEELKTELAKPITLKNSIIVKLDREDGVPRELPECGLNLPTKEQVFENPYKIEIQLYNSNKEVIARSSGQKKQILEIMRAYYFSSITSVSVEDDNSSYVKIEVK